jgi:hypothetical protein
MPVIELDAEDRSTESLAQPEGVREFSASINWINSTAHPSNITNGHTYRAKCNAATVAA